MKSCAESAWASDPSCSLKCLTLSYSFFCVWFTLHIIFKFILEKDFKNTCHAIASLWDDLTNYFPSRLLTARGEIFHVLKLWEFCSDGERMKNGTILTNGKHFEFFLINLWAAAYAQTHRGVYHSSRGTVDKKGVSSAVKLLTDMAHVSSKCLHRIQIIKTKNHPPFSFTSQLRIPLHSLLVSKQINSIICNLNVTQHSSKIY